ncbi:MAG TPA: KR domain-containing protein, partial [Ktedonobacteraceae bacterium]|nr:KR domain-containing protein [Ktedonobacteraceae bacterium]
LRGHLIQQQPGGSMLSVALPAEKLTPLLSDYKLDLAAINGPEQCIVSGSAATIENFEAFLAAKGVASRRLRTSHAFHSFMMEPVGDALAQVFTGISLNAPAIPLISNVTGTWITDEEATDPDYWARQLRLTVQFSAGVQQLLQNPRLALLEVGPGHALSNLAKRQASDLSRPIVASLRSSEALRNDIEDMLTALGKLWLAGVSVEWDRFWEQQRHQRVPLPGYPFERRPYWIQGGTAFQAQSLQTPGVGKRDDPADWFYVPTWKRADRVQAVQGSSLAARNWLILADRWGIGQSLAAELHAARHQVVVVYPGSHFAQLAETTFEVHPGAKEDFVRLLEILKESDLVPQSMVHLWSLDETRDGKIDDQQFTVAQERGLYSLLLLLQAHTAGTQGNDFAVSLITANLYEVIGNEKLRSEQAPVQAIRLVLGQEYPGAVCQNIDIQPLLTERFDLLSKQLTREILDPVGGASIALRGKHRWIETFDALPQEEEVPVLRQQGVYIIVGGLGRAGFLIASDLAQEHYARLVLIDKKDLAAENQAEQRAKIEEWNRQGAEVWVVQADGTDIQAMERIVAQTQQRWQAPHGVIFAAGDVLPLKGLDETTLEDLQVEVASRVAGLLTLEQALTGCQLDFCLVVSSLSSILGGLGHLAYAAANLFMDAFVLEHNQRTAQPWISVNWETWNLEGESTQQRQIGLQRLQLAMNPSEMLSTFRRILALAHTARIIVSSGDLHLRIQQWIAPTEEKKRSSTSLGAAMGERPVVHSTFVAPKNEVEQQIAQIYAELLGIERIGIYDNFFELGGDSLLAVQLVALLRQKFQRDFSLLAFFESPTVAELAGKFAGQTEVLSAEETEEILREIEQLSPEEALALLSIEEQTLESENSHE